MKRAFRNLPLRNKITLFTSMMVGVSLLTLTLITAIQEQSYSREELGEQANILLEVLPYSMRDELYFVKVDELRDVATKIGQSERIDRFVIYDRDGVILADSIKELAEADNPDEPAVLDMPENPDPFGVKLISLAPGDELEDWQREEQQFISGRAIHLNNETIGAVSVTMSTVALDKKINSLVLQSVMLTLFIIALSVILSITLAKQISNPLRELLHISREMANGSTDLRVNVRAKDEVGELGLAFNDMTEAIQTRERDLHNLTASLEQKVKERTEELRQRNEELVQMAISDPLTKIYNRRYFFDLAEKEYERARRYQHPISLVLADVDHFKLVNDTHGHLVGDETLENLARFLVSHIRGADVVARYGGEEFVILMPEIYSEEARLTAERLRTEIEEISLVKNKAVKLTVSFGVACWDGKEELSFENLLYYADTALYHAKDMGRNRVSVWSEDLNS